MKSQTKPITETTIAPGEQATQLFKFKNISDDVWLLESSFYASRISVSSNWRWPLILMAKRFALLLLLKFLKKIKFCVFLLVILYIYCFVY